MPGIAEWLAEKFYPQQAAPAQPQPQPQQGVHWAQDRVSRQPIFLMDKPTWDAAFYRNPSANQAVGLNDTQGMFSTMVNRSIGQRGPGDLWIANYIDQALFGKYAAPSQPGESASAILTEHSDVPGTIRHERIHALQRLGAGGSAMPVNTESPAIREGIRNLRNTFPALRARPDRNVAIEIPSEYANNPPGSTIDQVQAYLDEARKIYGQRAVMPIYREVDRIHNRRLADQPEFEPLEKPAPKFGFSFKLEEKVMRKMKRPDGTVVVEEVK